MKPKELILDALKKIPNGVVFDYSDLSLPEQYSIAAAQALSRMVKSGVLRKVGKGKFYKPKFSRFGEIPPMIADMIRDLLYKDGKRVGYITGVQAFSQMGLTTQISSKIIIACNSYRRPLKRGGYDISYTLQSNEITDKNILLLRILDAIKFIKEIPATTPDTVISQIKNILKTLSTEDLTLIEELSKKYPASTRALLGSILESEFGEKRELKESLNPFTKYKIGVSSQVLPKKANWYII
jgi:transposase